MAEGETQYNIPVSSKQLIVYFVFLVIALSAAFLAGVMVGRNVDSSPERTVRDIQDDRLPEEPGASPTPVDLTYGSALQSDKPEGLSPSRKTADQTPSNPKPVAPSSASKPAPEKPRPTGAPESAAARPTPQAAKPASSSTPPKPVNNVKPAASPPPKARAQAIPAPKPSKPAPSPLNRFTIQVGAFKERTAADSIVKRLKGKGYSAYLVPVSEGLFNVRVGSFTDREDAQRILTKLETQEKFKPFIVKP